MPKYVAKPLPFGELKGISKKTIDIHYGKLYQGYVNKTNEIMEKMAAIDLAAANQTYSEVAELKRQLSFAWDGVILHEAYFKSLGGDGKPVKGELLKMVEKDFGSFEKWQADFIATGMGARGWAILAYDWNVKMLTNCACDAHNIAGIWGAAPVIVLDVYEHAYFIDFGSDRKAYIDAYFENLNWLALEEKLVKKILK